MLIFLLNCLRFSKLLEILPSVWCNFSNFKTDRMNSFMQSLLQRVSFYLCLRPMNNDDKMIPSAAVTA